MFSLFPELAKFGIDFVDIGCSGQLDNRWRPLFGFLNYTGFDPDEAECRRLAAIPSTYRSTRYIAHAICGEMGEATIHLTESPFCSSLLRPRHEWLCRFSYHHLFREVGESSVGCVTLDHLVDSDGLRADILKLDTQGLELPILRAAGRLLGNTFCVETETGYVQNYVGETVASEIDEFMRSNGFLLFDVILHREGRANHLASASRKQPLWCESLWMRDYLEQGTHGMPALQLDRARAVKALIICRSLGFPDFGLELAEYFRSLGLLSERESESLRKKATWTRGRGWSAGMLDCGVGALPNRVRRALHHALLRRLD